jgi:peptide/nickel transport system permease protein
MLQYMIQRIIWGVFTLFVISIISFTIIQLPPGDFATAYAAEQREMGAVITEAELEQIREEFGLNDPFLVQYFRWIKGIVLEGDFGFSFAYKKPVADLIWERLGLTILISSLTVLFIWIVAIPIGVYSATHQYSVFDYILTFFGFVGRAFPNFMLALILMWIGFAYLGVDVSGLFSSEFRAAPWTLAKVWDMVKHLWVPLLVLGTGGTAGLIRVMRANTLDELPKPYVETARSKGLSEARLIWKYPVRVALNPFISGLAYILPSIISGAVITAVVLNLPTTGPLFLTALLLQDMYMAGAFVLILSTLTVIGTVISDILLVWVDPRIRYR